MLYFLANIAVAVWMYFDGNKRRFNAIPWSLGAIFFAVFITPIYLAKRPLLDGEVREGGFAWNALKYFAIGWTILMAGSAIVGIINASTIVDRASSEAEQIGASIGFTLGLGLLCSIWFFPLVGTATLAFLLRKPSVIERGSTLADVASAMGSANPIATSPWSRAQTTPAQPSAPVRTPESPLKPETNRGEAAIRRPPPPPPPPKRP